MRYVEEIVLENESIKKVFLCQVCKNPILEYSDGFIIKGNVYLANPEDYDGLIGNAFRINQKSFSLEDVNEYVFCEKCLLEILKISK